MQSKDGRKKVAKARANGKKAKMAVKYWFSTSYAGNIGVGCSTYEPSGGVVITGVLNADTYSISLFKISGFFCTFLLC